MFRNIGKGIYSLIRFSRFYSIYLRLFRKEIFGLQQLEKSFYDKILGARGKLVFDIGANVGDKASLFHALGHRVVAVDPDQKNHKILKRRFFFDRQVVIVNSALGVEAGKETFYVSDEGSSINTLSEKWKSILETPSLNRWSTATGFQKNYEVKVQTLDELIETHGLPAYAKIDVEGYELEVIKGLSDVIPVLTIEANFPEFQEETIGSVQRLQELNPKVKFNCIDSGYQYVMEAPLDAAGMVEWLGKTEMRYFELVCFNE